jgi:hypothetical protein
LSIGTSTLISQSTESDEKESNLPKSLKEKKSNLYIDKILNSRYDPFGKLELHIKWKGKNSRGSYSANSWEILEELIKNDWLQNNILSNNHFSCKISVARGKKCICRNAFLIGTSPLPWNQTNKKINSSLAVDINSRVSLHSLLNSINNKEFLKNVSIYCLFPHLVDTYSDSKYKEFIEYLLTKKSEILAGLYEFTNIKLKSHFKLYFVPNCKELYNYSDINDILIHLITQLGISKDDKNMLFVFIYRNK